MFECVNAVWNFLAMPKAMRKLEIQEESDNKVEKTRLNLEYEFEIVLVKENL